MPRRLWVKCACGHEADFEISEYEKTSREFLFPRLVCKRCRRRGAAVDMIVYWDTGVSAAPSPR